MNVEKGEKLQEVKNEKIERQMLMGSPDMRKQMLSGEKYQQRKPKLLITIQQGKQLKL